MNETQAVQEYYNQGQSEYSICDIGEDFVRIKRFGTITEHYYKIGFYEWLFNPKYKVFEVFQVNSIIGDISGLFTAKEKWRYIPKQSTEIIDYLYKSIGK